MPNRIVVREKFRWTQYARGNLNSASEDWVEDCAGRNDVYRNDNGRANFW